MKRVVAEPGASEDADVGDVVVSATEIATLEEPRGNRRNAKTTRNSSARELEERALCRLKRPCARYKKPRHFQAVRRIFLCVLMRQAGPCICNGISSHAVSGTTAPSTPERRRSLHRSLAQAQKYYDVEFAENPATDVRR